MAPGERDLLPIQSSGPELQAKGPSSVFALAKSDYWRRSIVKIVCVSFMCAFFIGGGGGVATLRCLIKTIALCTLPYSMQVTGLRC